MASLGRFISGGLRAGTFSGTIISHPGSVGLDGSDEDDVGLRRTKVELSQPWSILGEYAGVDGSESINVPNDFADIGGDIGPGDLGLRGDAGMVGDERPSAENC